MGSNSGYTVQAQLRYIIQWFHEWSEMQRSDFLPVLTQKFVPTGYVNGLVSGFDGLACQEDRPPSLFQCRVKLFREWSDTWSSTEREQLLNHIRAVDSDFVAKYEEEIQSASSTEPKLASPQPESLELSEDIDGIEDII